MRYLIALILPPLGLLLCGKWFQAFLSLGLMLTVLGWPLAAAWAVLVMFNHDEDRRVSRLVRALERSESSAWTGA